MKTDEDIKNGLYSYIKKSELSTSVTGTICKRGVRDPKSEKEDIVLKVVANEFAQKQEVIAYVNIYVQDDYVEQHNQYEEKSKRLNELSQIALKVFEVFRLDDARVTLTSQNVIEAGNNKEHVISNKLNIQLINE
jgi:hypothetical protein